MDHSGVEFKAITKDGRDAMMATVQTGAGEVTYCAVYGNELEPGILDAMAHAALDRVAKLQGVGTRRHMA